MRAAAGRWALLILALVALVLGALISLSVTACARSPELTHWAGSAGANNYDGRSHSPTPTGEAGFGQVATPPPSGASDAASQGDVSVAPAGFVAADEGATVADRAAAACGGGSFSPDTNVVMADGTTKPLFQVKVGDKVEATDTKTGKTTTQTVTTLWVNHDTDLMNVTIKVGGKTSIIHATQNHLFWDPVRHGWVEAHGLKAGERLRTDNGVNATVAGTLVIPGAADMWDLTVDNDHDFYVVTAAANVLVHNNNCGAFGTTSEATSAAKALGYTKTNYLTRTGQAVYKLGKNYISPDVDGHIGGVWKMARSPQALNSDTTRLGTYDADLNWIGK